jgi:hypothetical protein
MAFTVSLPELYRSIDVAWDDAIQKTQFIAKAKSSPNFTPKPNRKN